MRLHLITALIIFIAGCSNFGIWRFDAWGPIGYEGFIEKINISSGEDATNCGFHNLLTKPGKRSSKKGIQCVKNALEKEISFKHGTVRVPEDSFAYEILIGKPDGSVNEVVVDIMFDESETQQWVKHCSSASIDPDFEYYTLSECRVLAHDKWP